LAYFTGVGLLNYGNKNSFNTQTELNRTNVARLVNYIRTQLNTIAKPFIFEPNDTSTRNGLRSVVQALLANILTQRGLYDYLVVCDTTNNTPARIDANQLWCDVAIEPVTAVEFIYIPVRIENYGAISQQGASLFSSTSTTSGTNG
jgi:phage tail sheath protein FI